MDAIHHIAWSGMEIPDEAIFRIARAMLPLMEQYFESDEGGEEMQDREHSPKTKEAVPA